MRSASDSDGNEKGVKRMRMRGQLWSMDFAVSLIIFVLMAGMVVFAWNYTIQNSTDQVNFNVLENDVLMMSDTLIRVPGLPEDWNESTVRVIGLADEENVLNSTKVKQFVNMDYSMIKSFLGISNREFYFEINYPNNTVMEIDGVNLTKGTHPSMGNSSVVVPAERYILINGKIAKMELLLWF